MTEADTQSADTDDGTAADNDTLTLADTDLGKLANEVYHANAARQARSAFQDAFGNNEAVTYISSEDGLVHVKVDPGKITFAEIQRIRHLARRLGLVGLGPHGEQDLDPSNKFTFGTPSHVVDAIPNDTIQDDILEDLHETWDDIQTLALQELRDN